MKALKIIGWVGVGVAAVTALGLALGVAVMLLWNSLMPSVFGLPPITYWQSVGLLVLSHLLFSSHHVTRQHHRTEEKERLREDFASRVRALGQERNKDAEGEELPPEA
jgi:hypothetical protein